MSADDHAGRAGHERSDEPGDGDPREGRRIGGGPVDAGSLAGGRVGVGPGDDVPVDRGSLDDGSLDDGSLDGGSLDGGRLAGGIEVADPPFAGELRAVLLAEVDDALASDATWAAIVAGAGTRHARRRRRRAAGAAVLAVAAVLALVLVVRLDRTGDDGGQVTVGTQPEAPAPDPLEGTAEDSWVRLLGRVPADLTDRSLWIVDLQRARQQAGLEALPPGASADEWRALSQATTGLEDALRSAVPWATPEELRAELGISHEQFDQVLVKGLAGGGPTYVATGRFDPEAIAAAVRADPLWGPELEERSYRGTTYYAWGDELRLTDRRSPVRDLGVGGRLVVGDGWIAWCATDAEAEGTIDAAIDARSSLAADQPSRSAVADGDAGELIEMFVGRPAAADQGGSRPFIPSIAGLPTLDLPGTWSGGTGRSRGGRLEQFRFGYASEAQAVANLDAWRRSWEAVVDPDARNVGLLVERRGTGLIAVIRYGRDDEAATVVTLSDGTQAELNAGNLVVYFDVQPKVR